MMLAQKLYEGIELGEEGRVGLITYMRTDSTRLSDDAVKDVREFIYDNYGKEYLPGEARQFKKVKASQDAHEAIRPTSMKHTPKAVKKFLEPEMFELYELIWNRFVACQMSAAVFEQTTVDVKGGDYLFRATDSAPAVPRIPPGVRRRGRRAGPRDRCRGSRHQDCRPTSACTTRPP